MARYLISFNQNGDLLTVDDQVGNGISVAALYTLADVVVAETQPIREPGYAIDTITRIDAVEVQPRPGAAGQAKAAAAKKK